MRQESINLTKEIIIHIMSNLGFVLNNKFGTMGASTDNFIINKKLNISDNSDNSFEKYYCNIWAATAKFNNSIFRFLFTDLTSKDKIIDFALVLRVNNGPIHSMNLSFYDNEISNYFLIFDDKFYDNLSDPLKIESDKAPEIIEASTYDKCMALAGIELVTNSGVDWTNLDDYDDLYRALLKLMER